MTVRPGVRALRQYDDDFLLCRRGNLGHAWEVVGFFRLPDGITARRLRCPRCETTRTDHWDRTTGERHQPVYKYAAGFQISADGDHVDAYDVRLEVMRRADVYANEGAMLNAVTGGKGRK